MFLNQSHGHSWVLNWSDERRLLNWSLSRLFFDLVSQVTGCFEMLYVDCPELVPPVTRIFYWSVLYFGDRKSKEVHVE